MNNSRAVQTCGWPLWCAHCMAIGVGETGEASASRPRAGYRLIVIIIAAQSPAGTDKYFFFLPIIPFSNAH